MELCSVCSDLNSYAWKLLWWLRMLKNSEVGHTVRVPFQKLHFGASLAIAYLDLDMLNSTQLNFICKSHMNTWNAPIKGRILRQNINKRNIFNYQKQSNMRNHNDAWNKNNKLAHNSLTLFHFKAWMSLSRENMRHDICSYRRQRLYDCRRLCWVSLPFFPNHAVLMAQLYNWLCNVTVIVYDRSAYHGKIFKEWNKLNEAMQLR